MSEGMARKGVGEGKREGEGRGGRGRRHLCTQRLTDGQT